MKTKHILLLICILLCSLNYIKAQSSDLIEINNTSITNPIICDLGQIDSIVYTKFLIKNNRATTVQISDIKLPSGFFADFSDMTILPNKKVTLFVGVDPRFADLKGSFEKKIILKTNLVTDIEITLKGNIK